MTRILVQRGSSSSSSSSSQNRSSPSGTASSASPQQQATNNMLVVPGADDENLAVVHVSNELSENLGFPGDKTVDPSPQNLNRYEDVGKTVLEEEKLCNDPLVSGNLVKECGGLTALEVNEDMVGSSTQMMVGSPDPPPPPVPPPMPSSTSWKFSSTDSSTVRMGSSRRVSGWPGVSVLSSPTGSRPSSPRSHSEGEGYNSADEQKPCFSSSYDDAEREHQFVIELRRVRGLEVRRMLEDGNCLFRAVADQVYGDAELFDLVRQMCIDYMERERSHFSQFITEGFVSYCKRKRRDKVYGNNIEIQAFSEMYNRPIHIYSYSTEPINIFHGSYNTDTPPIRLSYHQGNHYNSLVDPRRLNIGAGLGLNSLQGANIDKDQVKAAIKAQQDHQIDNALLAEGRLYSDIELTEKEIERMVIAASRAEYLADSKLKQESSRQESSSTSGAEPSSSAARSSGSNVNKEGDRCTGSGPSSALSSSVQTMLSMGFSYLQVMEAHQIFGDDVDAMVCYLIETSSSGRQKGKAAE